MEKIKRIGAWLAAAVFLGASFVGVPATASADSSCPSGWLCIWDGFNYNGHKQRFYKCEFVNIGSLGWSDLLRSFKNPQTGHAVARFYNWNGSGWEFLDSSVSPEYIPVVNFPLRTTDAIQIC